MTGETVKILLLLLMFGSLEAAMRVQPVVLKRRVPRTSAAALNQRRTNLLLTGIGPTAGAAFLCGRPEVSKTGKSPLRRISPALSG